MTKYKRNQVFHPVSCLFPFPFFPSFLPLPNEYANCNWDSEIFPHRCQLVRFFNTLLERRNKIKKEGGRISLDLLRASGVSAHVRTWKTVVLDIVSSHAPGEI